MATTSTAPEVAAALQTQLDDALSDPVDDAHPGSRLRASHVWIGSIRNARHDYPVMKANRKKREEFYEIEVHFRYSRDGSDGRASREAAFEAFGELEDLIADDPQLGITGTPTIRMQIGDWDALTSFDESRRGYSTEITVFVEVSNRLN